MDLCNIQIVGLRNYFDKIQGENRGRVILSTTKSLLEKLDADFVAPLSLLDDVF